MTSCLNQAVGATREHQPYAMELWNVSCVRHASVFIALWTKIPLSSNNRDIHQFYSPPVSPTNSNASSGTQPRIPSGFGIFLPIHIRAAYACTNELRMALRAALPVLPLSGVLLLLDLCPSSHPRVIDQWTNYQWLQSMLMPRITGSLRDSAYSSCIRGGQMLV